MVIDALTTPKELLTLLLKNRGLSPSQFVGFIRPPLPELNLDTKKAVALIKKHLNKNILIYGDYDVDGISSTAILYQALKPLSPNITSYLPHRLRDGYGIKAEVFQRLNQKIDLLITLDNGIVAAGEFEKIKKLFPKIKILVVDHHLSGEILPPVDALIHSTITSAAGLAYFLAREFDPNADLGLAALGVVADCLPLVGINRSLVVHGLKQLRLSPSLGIKSLLSVAGVDPQSLTAYDLGFVIGPRLNAAGRLDDPSRALNLLTTTSPEDAHSFSEDLNRHNLNRRDMEKESLIKAETLIKKNEKFILISDSSFHPGVIGLLAGRLCEKYHLPTIVMAIDGDLAKASCRSIPGVNIIEVLRRFSDLFLDLGGHPLAAGFSLLPQNISKLEKKLSKYFSGITFTPSVVTTAEAEMKLSAVTVKNAKFIQALEPFGIGNPRPVFEYNNLRIKNIKTMGQSNDHLKLILDDPATGTIENTGAVALAFRQAQKYSGLKVGDTVSLLASLDLNVWNGTTTPQLLIKEIIATQAGSFRI